MVSTLDLTPNCTSSKLSTQSFSEDLQLVEELLLATTARALCKITTGRPQSLEALTRKARMYDPGFHITSMEAIPIHLLHETSCSKPSRHQVQILNDA